MSICPKGALPRNLLAYLLNATYSYFWIRISMGYWCRDTILLPRNGRNTGENGGKRGMGERQERRGARGEGARGGGEEERRGEKRRKKEEKKKRRKKNKKRRERGGGGRRSRDKEEEDNDCTASLLIFAYYNLVINPAVSYRYPGWHQVTFVQNKNQMFVFLLFLHERFNMTGTCSHWITSI